MMSPWMIAGNAGHALAAVLLVGLAILTFRRARKTGEDGLLGMALALTALWSMRHAFAGVLSVDPLSDGVAETVRNGAWLAVLADYLRQGARAGGLWRGRLLLLVALALLLVAQFGVDILADGQPLAGVAAVPVLETSWILRCLFALGALMLLHGSSQRRDHPTAHRREAWISGALAFLWAYDFNHYMLAWIASDQFTSVGPMRGFVMALLAVMLALGLYGDTARPVSLSRPILMRLVTVAFLIVYVLAIAFLAMLSGEIAAPFGQVVQFTMLFALAVGVLAIMSSASLRAWLRVELSKHLFAHRYDYRALWLRFAATVAGDGGAGEDDGGSLDARITRAIAEAMAVPGALLFLRDETGQLHRAEAWDWPRESESIDHLDPALAERMARSGWIVDIAADWVTFSPLLPAWMHHSPQAWVIAPLIHREVLLGAILLAAPRPARRLDWEDLDVLRVVCGEAAARISEVRSRAALAEAQRFDEFNRRFAFILHDLKNLVSQMSLLASNVERHADNPAFRADMVLTLQETAARMTDLIQRLAQSDAMGGSEASGLALGATVRACVPRWGAGLEQINVEGDVARLVRADAESLARALDHLVRNALDASPPDRPVILQLEGGAEEARIHVIDEGAGMSADFIAGQLFRPFTSTKAGGFGLGAHEARLLIHAMGGTLAVESVEGQGTRFTIGLPYAESPAAAAGAIPSNATRKTG